MIPGIYSGMGHSDSFAAPGSTSYTTSGSQSFVVPNYSTSLVIKLWGGGGGGGGISSGTRVLGASGAASTYVADSLSAGGGVGGNTAGGTGGTASGGDTNTTGNAGVLGGAGGSAPSGGAGGAFPGSNGSGNPGSAPGGGGSPYRNAIYTSGGGGSGAYVVKTYALGALTPGATLALIIGALGAGGTGSTANGGDGARGQIDISWT
jgi:hypothetical protein